MQSRRAMLQKNKRSKVLIIVLIAVLITFITLAAAGYYFLVYKPAHAPKIATGGQREVDAIKGTIQQMSDEEIQASIDKIIEDGMFRISIASNLIGVEDDYNEVRIQNHPTNKYVMQVDLYTVETDSATGKVWQNKILSTDYIDPGYYIQKTKYDVHVEPGEYDGLAIFSALYPDTGELVGTAGAQVHIYVGKASEITPAPTIEVPEQENTEAVEGQ